MFMTCYLMCIIIPQNELFSDVKNRIQKKLDIPDKEFEKVR